MKTRKLILAVIFIFATIVIFAGKKITFEDTYGTWINSDYNDRGETAVIILNCFGRANLSRILVGQI
jgi:hypothetical protein